MMFFTCFVTLIQIDILVNKLNIYSGEGLAMKTIGIISDVSLQDQQTAYCDSKEAVFQLCLHLKRRGHRVDIHASLPEYPLDIVLVYDLKHVVSLHPVAKRLYFWPQGICQQSYSAEVLSPLADVLWLTDWQRQQWAALNPTLSRFTTVFGYGVNPTEFECVRPRENPHSCVYASQDARGLELLLRQWAYLKMSYPKATLDLYYGEGHWETVSPSEQEAIRSKLARLKSLNVRERGQATRQEIHRALETSSMWLCPSVSPAASCMTAFKAQLSGAVPVAIVPRSSAYAEAIRVGAVSESEQNYHDILARIFSKIAEVPLSLRQQMGNFIHRELTWEKLAYRFEELIQ